MLSTNSKNYERIIISEKEFQKRYDKHSIYNPENCEDLINCCEARAPKANKVARALESPESPKANKIDTSNNKAANHYD